ncbi:family 78 glycoside hydrolase catalytic domain [Glycomyces sp. NPDC049804]|uniref:family 78 glycoside hydrolase catalytic domain n=1 Tax=Glycomyces sp. NPDC049804 TaxID=3154363 RepID=UPI0034164697
MTNRYAGLRTRDDSGSIATGEARPLLSWHSTGAGAYTVESAADAAFSEVIASESTDRTFDVPLPGPALASREVRWWRVRAEPGEDWSEPCRIEAALLDAGDWTARPASVPSEPGSVPLLRREFTLPQGIRAARLYVTALGLHQTWINGALVGEDLLEPGWTEYRDRLLYATYDVTELLAAGPNAIGAMIGDGWYRGRLGWFGRSAWYGDQVALLAQLEVETDAGRIVIATDGAWRGGSGAVTAAGLYEGCTIDLRKEPRGWKEPGFDDRDWTAATVLDLPAGLEHRAMPGVRAVRAWPVEAVADGERLRLDTGQNLSGHLRIAASGPAGAAVIVRHAEVLDDHGGLHTAPLRAATSIDRYLLDGEPAVLEPIFTFHGFRYAEITTDPEVRIEAVEAVAISSDLRRTGRFSCSDDRVNRLYDNVVWSQMDNFVSIPTDCPQRDERLGWTGDIQVFAPTACRNFDARSFLRNWLRDLAIAQYADGKMPHVVPDILADLGDWGSGSTGWGDAAVGVPWALYEAYGDLETLRDQYASMRAWVDWGAKRLDADRVWSEGFHFGDWLDPGAPAGDPARASVPTPFTATSYLSHSARLLARVAALLDRAEDARHYGALGDTIADAAWRHLGRTAIETQTGCAMALRFRIAPDVEREAVGERLAALVRANGGRIGTGFLGTPLVLHALTDTGHHEEAYLLLMNDRCPGWLHQIRKGATTVWERWDAIGEDGRVHGGDMDGGGSMLSFNHYAYGAVADWLYATVAGLSPAAPGWSAIAFAPVPGGGLSWASAEMDTPHGRAAIRWETGDGSFSAEVEVSPGATAAFTLPPGDWSRLRLDGRTVPTAPVLDLGPGVHRIALSSSPS